MKKRAIIGTAIILIVITVIGLLFYMVFYHESASMKSYKQSLAEPITDEMRDDIWANIKSSDFAYLQDPDFDVTAENFRQCFDDFLSVPARLYFYDSDMDANKSYKCDAPEIRVKFAEVLQDVIFNDCSEETYNSLPPAFTDQPITEIGFYNITGYVMVSLYEGHSYIFYSRYFIETDSYQLNYFYTEENLRDPLSTVYEEVLDYSMEAPASETH